MKVSFDGFCKAPCTARIGGRFSSGEQITIVSRVDWNLSRQRLVLGPLSLRNEVYLLRFNVVLAGFLKVLADELLQPVLIFIPLCSDDVYRLALWPHSVAEFQEKDSLQVQ